jgi:hypothetical protein
VWWDGNWRDKQEATLKPLGHYNLNKHTPVGKNGSSKLKMTQKMTSRGSNFSPEHSKNRGQHYLQIGSYLGWLERQAGSHCHLYQHPIQSKPIFIYFWPKINNSSLG